MSPARIAVCVATRGREAGLQRTLEGIAKQVLERQEVPQLRVIVVDNNQDGAAAAICDSLRMQYPWPLVYTAEPRVGTSFARNRALEMANSDDFIAFLDDDEVPAENWLSELLAVQKRYAADVVFGPVLPYFSGSVPAWVGDGDLFAKARKTTGTVCSTGGTGNVLLASRIVNEAGLRFDEKFALSGSEDYDFFWRVERAGYRQVWADEAIVTEWYPESRTKLSWFLKRHFRYGSTEIWLRAVDSIPQRTVEAAMATCRVLIGLTYALISIPLGKRHSIKGLRWASFGLGLLYGLTGRRFAEYRTIHPV